MERLLITDLDGTLVDTFPDLYASALTALQGLGISPREHTPTEARAYAGAGARGLLRFLLPEGEEPSEALIQEMIRAYAGRLTRASLPFPGTASWFAQWTVAVVTNKPRELAEPILKRFFPGRYALLVTPQDAGAPKPSPLPYARVLESLHPKETWVIGDDPRDYEAVLPLKLPFVIAGYGYFPPGTWDPYPHLPRIQEPEELLRLLPSPRG